MPPQGVDHMQGHRPPMPFDPAMMQYWMQVRICHPTPGSCQVLHPSTMLGIVAARS